jgi:DNA-binding MarR family transcriptional regulator
MSSGNTRRSPQRADAGYVRREPDSADRRRVIISPETGRTAAIAHLYAGMAKAWGTAMSGYDDDQLGLILDLFDRLHEITEGEIAHLRDTGKR